GAAVGGGRPGPPAGGRASGGQVAGPVEPVANGRRIEVALDGGARALVYDDGNVALLPGDRVRFAGVARLPRGYWDEGAFDRERLFAARGIDWEITALRPGVVPADEPPSWSVWRAAGALRERAAVGLAAASDGDGGAPPAPPVLGRRRRGGGEPAG